MYLIVIAILCFNDNVGANETDLMFDLDPDVIFKSLMGRDPNRIRETTHAVPSLSDQYLNFTKKNTTSQKFDKSKKNEPEVKKVKDKAKFKPEKIERVKKIPEIEHRMRELEIERIFANDLNPLPNFDKNEDDPTTITGKFDKLRAQIQRDGRRQHWPVRQRNMMRNRTLNIMEHFVYETRYKLPYSQILRAKYHSSLKYRIGYCYGLMYQLKRQQMLMYTQLHIKQTKVSTLFMHMRIYEKVVRLDVDLKDTIRLIRTLESKRRLKENPDYYDEDVEEGHGGDGDGVGGGDTHRQTTTSRPTPPPLIDGATRPSPPPPG